MKKISIIVPVYNSQNYIARTVDALLKQRHKDIEIILVDDGSQDDSAAICKALAEGHENIIFYRTPEGTPNSGPGGARNIGISLATGEYIAFCDSDDIPNEEMYETLLSYLEREEADVALCDIYSQRDGKNFGFPWDDGTVFCGEEVTDVLMASMIGNLTDDDSAVPQWGSVCRGLYKKSIIDAFDVKFPTEFHFAEDLVFSLRYLAQCKRAVICDKPLYFYTCNENSIMNSFYSYKEHMLESRIALVKCLEEIIQTLPDSTVLRQRLFVTERCYYHECVGNACRKKKGAYRELRRIVRHPYVKQAFASFKVANRKKKLIYAQIKHRGAAVLYLYYFLRFKLH